MKIEAFIKLIEDNVDGIAPGSLRADTVLTSIPQWDSLAVLTMLAQFDAEYGVQVSGMEMQRCTTVFDLFSTVSSRVTKSS